MSQEPLDQLLPCLDGHPVRDPRVILRDGVHGDIVVLSRVSRGLDEHLLRHLELDEVGSRMAVREVVHRSGCSDGRREERQGGFIWGPLTSRCPASFRRRVLADILEQVDEVKRQRPGATTSAAPESPARPRRSSHLSVLQSRSSNRSPHSWPRCA